METIDAITAAAIQITAHLHHVAIVLRGQLARGAVVEVVVPAFGAYPHRGRHHLACRRIPIRVQTLTVLHASDEHAIGPGYVGHIRTGLRTKQHLCGRGGYGGRRRRDAFQIPVAVCLLDQRVVVGACHDATRLREAGRVRAIDFDDLDAVDGLRPYAAEIDH